MTGTTVSIHLYVTKTNVANIYGDKILDIDKAASQKVKFRFHCSVVILVVWKREADVRKFVSCNVGRL